MKLNRQGVINFALAAGLAVAWVGAVAAAGFATPSASADTSLQPPAGGGGSGDANKDKKPHRHPLLHKAAEDLKDAREYLEKAPHDFGGHKADAMKAIDEALKQIKLAAEYDDTHTSPGEKAREKGKDKEKGKEKREKKSGGGGGGGGDGPSGK